MHLILVRHGETEWSRTGQHTGTTDLDLVQEGRAQAEALIPIIRRALDGVHAGAVYTSPLKRAVETAELATMASDIRKCDLLRECAYGAYEGLSPSAVREIRPGWDFWRDGCPEGENAASLGARADKFLASRTEREDPVIAFSHGHMIRVLAARALGLDAVQGQLFTLSTASVSVIKDVRNKRVIALWNQTADIS